jgi:hypothetical protein
MDELKQEFSQIEADLDALAARMKSFRLVHGVLLGNRLCLRSDSLQNARQLEIEWMDLVRARDRLITRRNAVLEKMAVLRGMKLPCNV